MTTTEARRTERILQAAETLFLRYGMRRTSVEDIAEQADMAKGTVYLSFRSKEALFVAVARRLIEGFRETAEAELAAASTLQEGLVAYLDGMLGEPGRLLEQTPHAEEFLGAKARLAPEIMGDHAATMERRVRQVLAAHGTDPADGALPRMLIEAAFGCKRTGPLARDAYRARLSAHVATLLAGAAAGAGDGRA